MGLQNPIAPPSLEQLQNVREVPINTLQLPSIMICSIEMMGINSMFVGRQKTKVIFFSLLLSCKRQIQVHMATIIEFLFFYAIIQVYMVAIIEFLLFYAIIDLFLGRFRVFFLFEIFVVGFFIHSQLQLQSINTLWSYKNNKYDIFVLLVFFIVSSEMVLRESS